ncbi:COG complex component [Sistotremastrum niveocremeum HHB9708]|uniref:Conserved oligomeric Golgi complex subunit 2 n=1 Tax=Sistotremastrum niveocremeum HHB9708 TaxID=1314777 RepID=A0A165A5M3_9AGAM|nr:COG complex component [Sistotremastrum niveocremeum HHB9708]
MDDLPALDPTVGSPVANGVASPTSDHVLPSLSPLSHANSFLNPDISPEFDVESFLLSRAAHASLAEIRSEMRDYLADLKTELVQLINDDYGSFISLSTDLRGEGTRLDRLKFPLVGIEGEINKSRQGLQAIQDQVQRTLERRAALREDKALLHLLLTLSESVSRLESLLLISKPSPEARLEDRSQTSKSKYLARVTSEYTQLLYQADKARAKECVFVNELQPRIDRIKSTLTSDLDAFFSRVLVATPSSQLDKIRNHAELNECLKIYDALSLQSEAEEIIRREVVRPFTKRTIFSSALTSPLSPTAPKTPFGASKTGFPQTPFTPYPTFPTSTPNDPSNLVPLLDETANPLAALFNVIIRFVYRDLNEVIKLTEHLRPKIEQRVDGGYQILAHVVWEEIGRAVLDDLGPTMFAVGKPDEFRQNYVTAHSFIAALESMALSQSSLEALRSHPISQTFEKRWQLPVYFQLRWKEIAVTLDDALSNAAPVLRSTESAKKSELLTLQISAVYQAIERCWSEDVFIYELSWRFWRFSLQIVARFKTWLGNVTPPPDPSSKVAAAIQNEKNLAGGAPVASRAVTPQLSNSSTDGQSASSTDDAILRKCALIIADMTVLSEKLRVLWDQQISILLPDVEDDDIRLKDILEQSINSYTSLIPNFTSPILAILSRRSSDALQPVRHIPSHFRAMSPKKIPTRPSEYVLDVLKPVRVFFGVGVAGSALGQSLWEPYGVEWATEIFLAVVIRFTNHLVAVKKAEESLRRLKMGKKSTFSLFGVVGGGSTPSSAASEEGRDEERIRTQLILDVDAFGKDAQSLGVEVEKIEAYMALKTIAAAKPEDGELHSQQSVCRD